MIIKDINKKIHNTPDNINEELAPISDEHIRNLFKDVSGDESNPLDYYTKIQTDTKLREVNNSIEAVRGEVTAVDGKLETTNQSVSDINSNLSKSENSSNSTIEGFKEFECKDGYIENIAIEGKTLVNRFYRVDKLSLTEASGNISTSRGTLTESSGVYTYVAGGNWDDIGQIISVNPNTKYTFSVNLIELNNKKCTLVVMFFSGAPKLDATGANEAIRIDVSKKSGVTTAGRHSHTFTTPENCTYILCTTSFETSGLTYRTSEYMLTEGDKTPYFKGVVSVGEGNRIDVSTLDTSNNLFFGDWKIGSIDTDNGSTTSSFTNFINTDFIYFNKEYGKWLCVKIFDDATVKQIVVYYYNDKKEYLGFQNLENTNVVKFDVRDNCSFVRLGVEFNNNKQPRANVLKYDYETQDGTIGDLDYIQPKYDKKQVNTTLRSLLNNSKESIYKINGRYFKRVLTGIHQCSGSDPLVNNIEVHGDYTRFAIENQEHWGIVKKENYLSICDKFKTSAIFRDTIFDEGHYTSIGGHIYFKVLTSRLSSSDEAGVKAFLETEKPVVVYELATPRLVEIPNFECVTFGNKTTLLINSGVVQADATFEVTNSLGSSLDVVHNKVSDIDNSISNIQQIHYATTEPTNDQGKDGDLWVIYEE